SVVGGLPLQFVDTFGVTRDVIRVVERLAQNDVNYPQRERRVGAGMNRNPPVGSLAGAVLVRIDHIEARTVAAGFHDERPEVHVSAENVRSPGDDQLRMAELFGLGAV